jgi:hypothetical protein
VANTLSYGFYKELRTVLENQKNYLYETNVGLGYHY